MPRTSLPRRSSRPRRSSGPVLPSTDRRDDAARLHRTDEGAPPLYLGGVLLVAFFAVIVTAGLF